MEVSDKRCMNADEGEGKSSCRLLIRPRSLPDVTRDNNSSKNNTKEKAQSREQRKHNGYKNLGQWEHLPAKELPKKK